MEATEKGVGAVNVAAVGGRLEKVGGGRGMNTFLGIVEITE